MTWTVSWEHIDAFADAPPVECEQEFDNYEDAATEAEGRDDDQWTLGVSVRNDDTGEFVPWPW